MLQNLSISGISFCGSDIPGFFGNVSNELLVRWYQGGVFFPFMRAHGHHKTNKREPWRLPNLTQLAVYAAIRLRYELLPYLYTTFYHFVYSRSWPIITPLWMAFKSEMASKGNLNKEFMFGPSFLVSPICKEGDEPYLSKIILT